MPSFRPSSDLRNSYNQTSKYFHACSKPVNFNTNGNGNLVVMVTETYEKHVSLFESSTFLDQCLQAV